MLHDKFVRSVSLSIALVLGLCLAFPLNASAALDFSGYFSFSYNSSIGNASLYPGGSLSPTITGIATCAADLPFAVSGANISGRVVAQGTNNERVVLNPGYSVSIGSFPTIKGQSVQESQTIDLSFPGSMAPGQYNIVGEVIAARVQVVLWFDVTSYVPSSMSLGTVTILGPPAPVPTPPPIPTPEPAPSPNPEPPPAPLPVPVPAPTSDPAPILTPTPSPTPTPVATTAVTSTPVPTTVITPTVVSTLTPTTSSPEPAPVPPTSSQVIINPSSVVFPTTSTPESPLPVIQTSGQPPSSSNRVSASAGTESWVWFPVSVGALTFLLVILAVIRTPRARLRKEDYTLKLPPEN